MIDLAIFTVCTFLVFVVPAINNLREARKARHIRERSLLLQQLCAVDVFLGVALRTCHFDERGRPTVLVQRRFRQ